MFIVIPIGQEIPMTDAVLLVMVCSWAEILFHGVVKSRGLSLDPALRLSAEA